MSDRNRNMSRLAAREQEEAQDESEDVDSEKQEDKESQENQDSTQDTAESRFERSVNVKDRNATMFAYLPKSLDNEVDLACQSVNLTYQQESGEKLGKNRYLYPIILMVGADNAVDLSYEEIQDLVERVDEVEDAN